MQLSDKACKAAKAKEKRYKLYDGGGLYLEVTPKGSKLWRLKYRFLDRERKLSIGKYPIISLADARNIREDSKRLIAEGIDPSQAKQDEKKARLEEAANTFEVIAREWYGNKLPEWSKTNADTILRRLEKDVFPVIGQKPIRELLHTDLLTLAQTIKERGANELAKRVIQMSRHIFQYAIITGRADKNIAEDLKGIIKAAPRKHFAAIEVNELPKFIYDLRSHKAKLNRQTYLAVNFMMLTFVRTGEMIKAEWSEFDLEGRMWLIPAKRMKMNKDHLVPLAGNEYHHGKAWLSSRDP